MNNRKSTTIFILGFLALLSLLTVLVFAENEEPYGVRTITYLSSSRANLSHYTPSNISTEAGNLTEITLNGISTTKAWAGYYGNITGTLTLENSDGYVFYNWTATEPKGEIYASTNSSITWSAIKCFEWAGVIGLDKAEDWYGIEDDDADGINETFTDNTNTQVEVGDVNIVENTCPSTNPFQYNVPGSNDFENLLLTDDISLVFTAVIENNETNTQADELGFDNRLHDFQILVAENGHGVTEDAALTLYYFWAEIE
jgi:hypothetical protein